MTIWNVACASMTIAAVDVEVERELYRRLPPLSPDEQELWQLDADH